MKKKCYRCQKSKDVEQFSWKKLNVKRQDGCKDCMRAYNREHYNSNKQYYLDKARKRNDSIKASLYEVAFQHLLGHPCVDCGEDDPLVLEFDHRKDKVDNILTLIMQCCSEATLIKEISKCDVRCRNCHIRLTAKQQNSWKYRRVTTL